MLTGEIYLSAILINAYIPNLRFLQNKDISVYIFIDYRSLKSEQI